jgi:UDP-N-acetylglucosamine--N-acetylmuramyl-(pentapeptide) pyrophosphoryl-undecaprenol N-acetylglucosamine transferase
MRLLLTGGGTLGSVLPLIAIAQKLKAKDSHIEIYWVGTKAGPEKKIVLNYGLNYISISTGKLRRYFSLKNLTDIIKIFLGFIKSIYIIYRVKPNLIIGAGSFTQVPVIYAGSLFKKKIIIHQQDIKKGLANNLCAKFADKIIVSLSCSLADFPAKKTVLIGNPYRTEILQGNVTTAGKIFNLQTNLPVILILGGGTGALSLNRLLIQSLAKLTRFCQVIHITGKSKQPMAKLLKNYHPVEFIIDELKHAYAAADLVITRAGFSTLTELSVLAKPTLIVPIPSTHQEDNAKFFADQGAAVVLEQNNLTSRKFVHTIKSILENRELRFRLSSNISKIIPVDSTEMFIKKIGELMDNKGIEVKRW